MSDDQDPEDKILPTPKIEPWQQEIYDLLKADRVEIDVITGALTNLDTITGRYINSNVPYNCGVTPTHILLDEWGNIPKPVYERNWDYVEKDDGPKKPYWTQPIPDPQADKPVSSPSAAKRAKLRAKRKRKK